MSGGITIFLEYYKSKRGDNPVIEYIMQIDDIDEAADIFVTLKNIDRYGSIYLINGGEVTRSLGQGLWEIKKNKNRFYYCYCLGNKVYMLHACYKQKGKAQKHDLEIGKKRMHEIAK